MDSQNSAGFGYNMDFSSMKFDGADYTMKPSEGNTDGGFFFGDEGIDTTCSFNPSIETMNTPLFPMSNETSFPMQQNLTMDNTLVDGSSWHSHLGFAAAPMQPTLASYQPFNGNMKRPLQLDTQEYPQSKRQESSQYASNFTSPYLPSASLTASSWTMDTQATPCSSSAEVGLSDEAADVCAMWFSKYAMLPNDRHIESLGNLTGEPAGAIRSWFSQMLKQGMAGHDSAYKSQTRMSQPDSLLQSPTTQSLNETSVPALTNDTTVTTTASRPMRNGKKGCRPTDNLDLLRADAERIYQCTRKCGKRYMRKCDWKRNEEEGYPSKSWKCSLCISQGSEKVKPCFRRYHFAQHFRNMHKGEDSEKYEATSLVHSETTFPRRCGFCTHRFDSRQERINHIAEHFKQGKCMLDWNDEADQDSDGVDGDDDDDNNDNDGNNSDDFQGNSRSSSSKPSGNQGAPEGNQDGTGNDGNDGNDGGFGSFGDFGFFQLSGKQHSSSSSQCSSSDKGSEQRFEEGIIEETHSSAKDQGTQGSIQQSSLCPPDPECCVPGGSSWNSETTGDDAHALARNVVPRSLTDKIQSSKALSIVPEDVKKLWTLFSSSIDERVSSSSVATDQLEVAKQAIFVRLYLTLLQAQEQVMPKKGPQLPLPLPPPIPDVAGLGQNSFWAFLNEAQQQGLLYPHWKQLQAKGQPDVLLDLLVSGGMPVNVLKHLHFSRAEQMTHDGFKINKILPIAGTDEDVQTVTRRKLLTDRIEPGVLQEQIISKDILHDRTRPAEWSEISAQVEDFYLKSQSFLSMKLLGSGGFSTVDEVVHQETNLRLSRKTLKNRQHSAVEELRKEVQVLQKLRHPHIIRFLGAYSKGDKVSVLLSPVAETTLAVWLEQCHVEPPVGLADTIVKMFGCLASSVRYLHEQRPVIKHMDIKPQNILVMHGSDDVPHVVLTDFGISSSDDTSLDQTPKPLTRRYCAPEVSSGTSRERASDVFSLGCVFMEMLAAGFGQDNSQWAGFRKEFSGRKGKYYWQQIPRLHELLARFLDQAITPTEATTLRTVKSMLNGEPADRPSAAILTMVFTPASCCLSWPNEGAFYPGPIEELQTLDLLHRQDHAARLEQTSHCDALGVHDEVVFARAKTWLQECSQDHEACIREVCATKALPTRLLDLRPDDGQDVQDVQDGSWIRLVNSADLAAGSDQTDYVAVSHTWGDTDLTLSEGRLADLQSKLPKELLSQALQDVIEATDRIGTRYIWVDSLCVVQDSQDDKKRECATMASIYRNAALTIIVQTADESHDSIQHVLTIDCKTPGFAWDTRIWSLQERLLSSRLLHLTPEQMYWECNSLKASETFPHGLPSLVWEKVHTKSLDSRPPLSSLPALVGGRTRREVYKDHNGLLDNRLRVQQPTPQDVAHKLNFESASTHTTQTPSSARNGHRHSKTRCFDFKLLSPSKQNTTTDTQVSDVGKKEGLDASRHESGTHFGKAQTDMDPAASRDVEMDG